MNDTYANVKEIRIEKGGFGIASLFSEKSTKKLLIQQPDLDGKYLEELGIDFEVGDEFTLQVKIGKGSSFKVTKNINVKVIDIRDEAYICGIVNTLMIQDTLL
jgi:hypothetical protein